ncbi:hypothetical protein [Bradyrhizobium sp. LMTR 3]|uniref:hypothetical protein n=1 Tax=Bradyrhizobium sp. LMTR 3 TaxID=189873 RepID=UPI0008105DF7|nr:hypothetical protein [Bradyrhizobium sp. LMTR 3]OCK55852.1 hypothetical protein LMTR3_33655 [Bradyrhizobium sp. LMTR 3]
MRTHSVEDEPRQRTRRKGLFARILEALHRSRRREAIRVLRRYRHLFAGQAQIRPVKHVPESRQAEASSRNAHGNNAPVRADRKAQQDAGTQFA